MKKFTFAWILFAVILGACAPGDTIAVPAGGVRAWIDNPRQGEQFLLGETVPIRWHASAPEGIQMVEVKINAETFTLAGEFDHAAALVTQQHAWTPPSPGDYLIEVIATSNSGAVSSPSANVITILSAAPTTETSQPPIITSTDTPIQQSSPTFTIQPPTSTFTPIDVTPSLTSSPKCPGPPSIQYFTASPATIIKGKSTTLSWGAVSNAASVTIDQGVGSVATPGTRLVSPKTTTAYTLTATGCGGTVTSKLIVTVKATLPTDSPIPPPDTTGPPAPDIILPANDAILPCSQKVKLTWATPPDPSGIARYRVRLQITSTVNPSDQDWSDVRIWDPLIYNTVNADEETTCGGFYRWRVVAYDGAGNQGKVSVWALFKIELP